MKLSTKGRYGVRLMIALAGRYGQGPVSLSDIARTQQISEKYLGRLVPLLRKAGLIRAARGAHGGYTLAKHPKKINILDVVAAAEGPVCVVDCVSRPSSCGRARTCAAREIWQALAKEIQVVLRGFTLETIAARQEGRLKKARGGIA